MASSEPTRPRRLPLFALVGAYLVSGIGTAMSAVAIPWLVLVTTGSAAATGLVGFAQMAPYVVFQVMSGPLIDRIGLRRAFLAGNALAGCAVCAIPALYASGALPLGLLAGLGAIAGAARGVADSATTPMIPPLTALARTATERAIGLYSAANRTAMLVGMPLAGVVIAVAGPATAVLADGVSFLAGVAVVAAAVPPFPRSPARAAPMRLRGFFGELGEGLRFLRSDRLLLAVVALVVVTNLLDEALTSVFLPVWAHDRVHRPEALGLVGGLSGVGMLVGVSIAAWLGPRLPRWLTFALGNLLSAAPPFFALAGWDTLVPVGIVFAACGVFGGMPNPIIGAVQFERIPEHLQTRVLGAIKASAWVGVPFGALLGGALTQATGLAWAVSLAGTLMLLVTAAPLVFPMWRQLDRAPDPAS